MQSQYSVQIITNVVSTELSGSHYIIGLFHLGESHHSAWAVTSHGKYQGEITTKIRIHRELDG